MIILKHTAFVKTHTGDIGIATSNAFASAAWLVSDELYNNVLGEKFTWLAPDGQEYAETKHIMSRPTEQEISGGLSEVLIHTSAVLGYIQL